MKQLCQCLREFSFVDFEKHDDNLLTLSPQFFCTQKIPDFSCQRNEKKVLNHTVLIGINPFFHILR